MDGHLNCHVMSLVGGGGGVSSNCFGGKFAQFLIFDYLLDWL